ncbi:MAG TPA: hypothetical protein PLE19_09785 [Planctomycetota bacterium]|nr:hypothetical protein [Planctomycetota bacterium]HRR79203.1 hypothetical protein [Planctomycetota bacterium]HRT94228.1 hypothetical protein [Planctomycetota bacterium]
MGYFTWANAKIKKMTWPDIACTKIAAMAFALMVAKLWPGLLGLDWYWYAAIAVVASVRPLVTLFGKG